MMIELVLVTLITLFSLYISNEFRAYYFIKPPEVYSKESGILMKLLNNCKSITSPYIPTFWAVNGHLQTWLKSLVRFGEYKRLYFVREYLQMYDDGVVSLDWVSKTSDTNEQVRTLHTQRRRSFKKKSSLRGKPLLLIIPSALNTNVSDYTNLCKNAITHGFKPVFFNRRGYSGTPLVTPKVTTYCDRSDLQEVVQYLKTQHPFNEIYAIAFSLETGNLISYLGHERESSQIAGAVCVSSTFGCENHLDDHALKEPYNTILTEKIKTIFQENDLNLFENDEVNDCHNIVQLQNEIHARSNAYQTLKDYLEYNSPLRHLNRIRVPVLFVQAKDDPVVPEPSIPYEFFAMSDSCVLVCTEHGGHCGFFEGLSPNSWSDEVAMDFLKIISRNRKLVTKPKTNGVMTRSRAMTIL